MVAVVLGQLRGDRFNSYPLFTSNSDYVSQEKYIQSNDLLLELYTIYKNIKGTY
jgi:hypothetical protein